MAKIILYTLLLLVGLVFSQILPVLSQKNYFVLEFIIKQFTMILLAFIMIHVGLEFKIAKNRLKDYGKDYFVAFTTATFPWILCSIYFVYMIPHNFELSNYQIWSESLLIGRFAAPTSAGVLFTMLAGAGLAQTWVYKKSRILAIFDDLDTILLMIPLKMMLLGIRWELSAVVIFLVALLILAWKKMHKINLPLTWYWILLYSLITVIFCEAVYLATKSMESLMSIHLEVLLPAFVLGCVLAYPQNKEENLHKLLETLPEKNFKNMVSAFFMLLVGLSMPPVLLDPSAFKALNDLPWWKILAETPHLIYQSEGVLPMRTILFHTVIITILSNIGKMVPAFFYREVASLRERIALALAMCPRGEVGAGIIIVSLSLVTYAESPMITIAMFSLALNLILTGPLIIFISKMLKKN